LFFAGNDKLIKRARKSLERKPEIFLDRILDRVNPYETNDFYDFGEFHLDPQKRRLWRGSEMVALTPKEFEVLFFLVKRAGEVVEKEELLDAVWRDVYVEETTLARNVSWLRQKLGAAKLIETVPKRGYRFLLKVTRRENAPAVRIEEKILQRVIIEETITFVEPEPLSAPNEFSSAESNLPEPKLLNPKTENRNPKSFWLSVALGATALAAICFAVYQTFSRRSEPKVVVAQRVVPFSGLPGRENFPAFSPDGKLLAYVWNGGTGENYDVYVKQIGAGEPVRLTDKKEDEVHPVFSPDGLRVAFVRTFSTHSEVFLIPTLGGSERKICDLRRTYSRLSFSPDGQTLAATEADSEDEREGIFLIDVQTGAKRRQTSPPDSASDIAARFSPDGKIWLSCAISAARPTKYLLFPLLTTAAYRSAN
jgi:DNA-binding winged helix-turn-helix (wHTH) protein